MRYTRNLISFVILTFLVGLGSLVLSTGQVRALEGPCNIIITKETIPADNDNNEFVFTAPGSNNPNFILTNPDNPTANLTIVFDTTVIVTEEPPPGWAFVEAGCTNNNTIEVTNVLNGLAIKCLFDTGTFDGCFFTNEMLPPPPPATIPTLSEWGLIAMAVILGIAGFMVIRRRKVSA